MRNLLIILCLLLATGLQKVLACEVCKNNQPEVLKNITHGTGPQGNWDYIIIWSAALIVGVTLFLSLKYLIRPKENNPKHIKNIVLNENN